MILSEHQILDWTDRLYLILRPEDKQTLKFWPENPESFRYSPSSPLRPRDLKLSKVMH